MIQLCSIDSVPAEPDGLIISGDPASSSSKLCPLTLTDIPSNSWILFRLEYLIDSDLCAKIPVFLMNSGCSDADQVQCDNEEQSFVCLVGTGAESETAHTITLDIPSMIGIGGSEDNSDDSSPVLLLSYKGMCHTMYDTLFVRNIEEVYWAPL